MKKNKLTQIIAAFTILGGIVGSTIYFSLPMTNKNQMTEQPKLQTEEDKYQEKQQAYEKRVTTFTAKDYETPINVLSSSTGTGKCIGGLGGNMQIIHSGMYDEPLYNLDAEKLETDISGKYAYIPYVNAFIVRGDTLFKKPLDWFNRDVLTTQQLTRGLSDSRIIVDNISAKSSFTNMESRFGFPLAYLVQQAGNTATLSLFNDPCIKNLGTTDFTYKKIDLSGRKFTDMLSMVYTTQSYPSANGLSNYTSQSSDYVGENFAEWVKSNNNIFLRMLSDKNGVFPEGSFFYVPQKFKVSKETIHLNLNDKVTQFKSKEEWAKSLLQSGQSIDDFEFVPEKFEEFTVYKLISHKNSEPVTQTVIAEKDKSLYWGTWQLPNEYAVDETTLNRNQMVFFNLKAVEALVNYIKKNTQGSQLDIGTQNENLQERFIQSQKQKAEMLSNKDVANLLTPHMGKK